MLRRLIVTAILASGMSVAAAVILATPALAKGPSQARITGPGLAHPIVLSGGGEPGQPDRLATLASQTSLFAVLFGAASSLPQPARLRAAPPAAALGPGYALVYTVPGVTPPPGARYGRIRQELYPYAAAGPLVYTPPGQHGFGQAQQLAGWVRGTAGLSRMLARLGIPPRARAVAAQRAPRQPAARPAAGQQARPPFPGWLAAAAATAAALLLAGAAQWLRRHRRIGRTP